MEKGVIVKPADVSGLRWSVPDFVLKAFGEFMTGGCVARRAVSQSGAPEAEGICSMGDRGINIDTEQSK